MQKAKQTIGIRGKQPDHAGIDYSNEMASGDGRNENEAEIDEVDVRVVARRQLCLTILTGHLFIRSMGRSCASLAQTWCTLARKWGRNEGLFYLLVYLFIYFAVLA